MRSISLKLLLAYAFQSLAKEVATPVDDKLVDILGDKLLDRTLSALHLQNSDLDDTMLAKPGVARTPSLSHGAVQARPLMPMNHVVMQYSRPLTPVMQYTRPMMVQATETEDPPTAIGENDLFQTWGELGAKTSKELISELEPLQTKYMELFTKKQERERAPPYGKDRKDKELYKVRNAIEAILKVYTQKMAKYGFAEYPPVGSVAGARLKLRRQYSSVFMRNRAAFRKQEHIINSRKWLDMELDKQRGYHWTNSTLLDHPELMYLMKPRNKHGIRSPDWKKPKKHKTKYFLKSYRKNALPDPEVPQVEVYRTGRPGKR